MPEDHWKKTHLNLMPGRPPWRPSREDGTFMHEMAERALGRSRKDARVLVLGVTPEIIQLDWPNTTHIVAIDSSPGMIASTWRPHPTARSSVVCARWQETPLMDAAFDAVVGDGSLNALPDLNQYRKVFEQASRVLRPGGLLVLRCFLRPDSIILPAQVVSSAVSGAFPTTSAFRLRFAFSLTGSDGSVGLAHLRESFNALVPDRDGLAHATGWPREDIDKVDIDKDSQVRLTFPTQSELTSLSEPIFEIERLEHGTYTQSEYCPTVLFRRPGKRP